MEVAFDRNVHPRLNEADISLYEQPTNCNPTKGTNDTYISLQLRNSLCTFKDQVCSSVLNSYCHYIHLTAAFPLAMNTMIRYTTSQAYTLTRFSHPVIIDQPLLLLEEQGPTYVLYDEH